MSIACSLLWLAVNPSKPCSHGNKPCSHGNKLVCWRGSEVHSLSFPPPLSLPLSLPAPLSASLPLSLSPSLPLSNSQPFALDPVVLSARRKFVVGCFRDGGWPEVKLGIELMNDTYKYRYQLV